MRPPLVDSQLLRFVKTQKQTLEGETNILQARLVSESSTSLTSDDEMTIYKQTEAAGAFELMEQFDQSVAAQLALTTIPNEGQSSFGQFNRHRVALVLQDHGAEPQLAFQVGECVQTHALLRNTRRRIRTFLRQRDMIWRRENWLAPTDDIMDTNLPQQPLEDNVIDKGGLSTPPMAPENALPPDQLNGLIAESFTSTVRLMLDQGLTIKDVCEILLHSPGIALMQPFPINDREASGETLQETLSRVVTLLQQTLALRKYDARKVIRTSPGLLSMRGSKHAEQLVLMMSRSLGVSTSSLARDKNALCTLLSRSPAAVFRFIAFLSSDTVRMPMENIGPLLRRTECKCVLDEIAPVAESRDEPSFSNENLADAVDSSVISALWGRRQASQRRRDRVNEVYKTMSKTAMILRHEIGAVDLGKVIAAYPGVLLLDAETEILPAANYLMNMMGIWKDALPRVLQLYPAVLGVGVDHMREVVEYLLALEVKEENLGGIIRAFPSLLTLNIKEDMEPVVNFLRDTVGISNIGRYITRLPPVLGYSVDRELQTRWDFLQTIVIDAPFEASLFPAYFSYPLERVIKNRFAYLQQVKKIPPSLLPLDSVLRFGDKDFATQIARDKDNGKAYLAFCDARRGANHSKDRKRPQKQQKIPSKGKPMKIDR
jgi:hypothetical protein